jgi:hypothetical protein
MRYFYNIINISAMSAPELFEYAVAGASGIYTLCSVWQILRTPKQLTVTRKDTGKSVVINMRGGAQEGAKLTALFE